LHLIPETDAAKLVKDELPPLPLNKSTVNVLADFLRYPFRCASSYIKGAHVNGGDLWQSIEEDISFVLAYPNGWEGFQKSQMRRAAVLAGLIPATKASILVLETVVLCGLVVKGNRRGLCNSGDS